ncbi:MAG: diacylglycerol kinase family lipid kinase [Azospirillum sp.]|nr:diacylglycerol kinase family lipid kinase [Azospirillum sp.]
MKLAVVLNEGAGTLLGVSTAEAVDKVRRWFAEAGADAEVIAVASVDLARAIDGAVAGDAEAVVVGGGDGTIATAAEILLGSGKALGVLPLGTLNLIARDLGIPLDLRQAVTALAKGTIRAVDVGEVNGRLFLVNSVMGLYPALVRARERHRGTPGPRKWLALTLALYRTIRFYDLIGVTLDLGSGAQAVRTPALAVTNNVYAVGWEALLSRRRLDQGVLAVYLVKQLSRLGLLGLLARLAVGGWTDDTQLESVTMQQLTVTSRRRRIKLVNDGEIIKLSPPLHYRIRPAALTMLVPANKSDPGKARP